MITGSFAKRNLQLKASYASSPPCSDLTSRSLQDVLYEITVELTFANFLAHRVEYAHPEQNRFHIFQNRFPKASSAVILLRMFGGKPIFDNVILNKSAL